MKIRGPQMVRDQKTFGNRCVAERSTSAAVDLNPDLTERVPGLLCNVDRGLFGFKVRATLPTRLTRGRVLSVICSLYNPLGVPVPL